MISLITRNLELVRTLDADSRGPRSSLPSSSGEIDVDRPFMVGSYRVDPEHREVWLDTQVVLIGPTDLAVLQRLVRSHGRVVSKEQLLRSVWGDRFVGEHALTNAIHELRKAFGDAPRRAKVIRTVHRRGYELVADVRAVEEPKPEVVPRAWLPWVIPALVLVVLAAVPFGLRLGPLPTRSESVNVDWIVSEASVGADHGAHARGHGALRRDLEALVKEMVIQADHLKLRASGGAGQARARLEVIVGDQMVEVWTRLDGEPQAMSTTPMVDDWPAAAQAVREAVLFLDFGAAGELGRDDAQDRMAAMLAQGAVSREAVRLRELGEAAFARRNRMEASRYLDRALEADEHDPATLASRARLREDLLQLSAAQEDLRRAAEAARRRGVEKTDYDRLEARAAKVQGAFAPARRTLLQCNALRSYESRCQFELAWQMAVRERDCEGAINAYQHLATRATEPLPDDFDAHFGEAQLLCGQVADAEASFRRFETRKPADDDGADAASTWAWFFLLTGRLDEAEARLEALERIDAGFYRLKIDRGNLALARGRLPEAARWFTAAGRLGEERTAIAAKVAAAAVAILEGEPQRAIERAEQAHATLEQLVAPAEANVWLSDQVLPIRAVLGLAWLAEGDLDRATGELDRLEDLVAQRRARNDESAAADRYREEYVHLLAGLLHAHAGRLEEARLAFDQLLAVRPYDDPFFQFFIEHLAAKAPVLSDVHRTMARHLAWP